MSEAEGRHLLANLSPDEKAMLLRLATALTGPYAEANLLAALGGEPTIQETRAIRSLVRKGLLNIHDQGIMDPKVQ